MSEGLTAPHSREISQSVPAVTIAADDTAPIGVAPFDGTVTSVTFIADTAIVGADTDTRLHELVNRGQAGAGTTVVASLQYDDGVDADANDATALTLAEDEEDLVVAEGDVLEFVSTAVGDGLADPGGLLTIGFSRS